MGMGRKCATAEPCRPDTANVSESSLTNEPYEATLFLGGRRPPTVAQFALGVGTLMAAVLEVDPAGVVEMTVDARAEGVHGREPVASLTFTPAVPDAGVAERAKSAVRAAVVRTWGDGAVIVAHHRAAVRPRPVS
jgi:hypothetical protein